MKKSLSKKSKKVIEEHLEELMALPPLTELTRIGARMMLQVAWAFLENGSRELVGVSLGNRESYNAWKDFLVRRGMGEPMLTTIDGCPGLIKVVDEVFPESDKQRCTKHKTENVLDKVLEQDRTSILRLNL